MSGQGAIGTVDPRHLTRLLHALWTKAEPRRARDHHPRSLAGIIRRVSPHHPLLLRTVPRQVG